jgi:hypothetical protein
MFQILNDNDTTLIINDEGENVSFCLNGWISLSRLRDTAAMYHVPLLECRALDEDNVRIKTVKDRWEKLEEIIKSIV